MNGSSAIDQFAKRIMPNQPPWRIEDIHFLPTNGQLRTSNPALRWLVVAASLTDLASSFRMPTPMDSAAGISIADDRLGLF